MWRNGDDWSYADNSLGQAFRSQLGEGYITASDGDFHRYQRRLLRPFFNGEHINRHMRTAQEILQQGFARCAGRQIDLHQELIFLYTRILNSTMVSSHASDAQIYRFAQFEEEFIRGAVLKGEKRRNWYARPSYVKLRDEVFAWFTALVEQRLAGSRPQTGEEDNLDRLIDAMRLHHGGKADREELIRDAYLMQAGGAGNMASLCCSLLWATLNQPEWYEKVKQEFSELDPMLVMQNGIGRMPLTRVLMLETERRYPVTPGLPKTAVKDVTLLGYDIPQGEEVMHLFALSHFMDEYYEKPFVFNPERWLNSKPLRPHAFGGGEHVCIGMNLSYLFVVLSLRELLTRFEINALSAPRLKAVAAGHQGSPLRIGFDVRLSSEPSAA